MLAPVVLSPPRLGPYEITRPLGAGGMAETFVAVRRGPAGFEQRVCLRRILPAYASEPKFVEQFLDEARLLAHLHNANIVQVIDFGQVEGIYYMALELVDGVDLDVLLSALQGEQVRLPVAVGCYIGGQLLSALDYAHGISVEGRPLGLVHRDVSPANVLLSCHGEVKLTDFGIAKSSTRKHKTRTGYTKGKLAYMSPEQVRGDELDSRSDLFAIGVVLYEMLAGIHPFEADTDLAIINNILTGKRPSLAALSPGLPPQLLHIVDLLLQPDRQLRPQTAGDALRLLPFLEPTYVSQRTLSQLVSARQARAVAATPQRQTPESSAEPVTPETEPLRPSTDSTPEVAKASLPASTPAARPARAPEVAPRPARRVSALLAASLVLGGTVLAAGLILIAMDEPAAPALPAPSLVAREEAGVRPVESASASSDATATVQALPQVISTGTVDAGTAHGNAEAGAHEPRRHRTARAAREPKGEPRGDAKGRGHSGVSVSADEF